MSIKQAIDGIYPSAFLGFKRRVEASAIGSRLARGAFWSLAGTLTARGLGLLAGILVARLLGKESYGQLGVVQNTVGMFGIFAGFGMGLTANKHVAEFKRTNPVRAGGIICLSSLVAWGTGGVMTLSLYALAPWLARTTLASPAMSPMLRTGVWLLLLGGINGAQTGALAGFEAFKTIARVNLMTGLLSFPMLLAGAWFAGVHGAVWALVANLAVNCLFNYVALRAEAAKAGIPLHYRNSLREWPVLWSFSFPAVLSNAIAGPITWAASAWLVNQPHGYAQIGIFNAVYRIKIVPEMLLSTLLAPLLPMLSEKFGQRDVEGYRKIAYSALRLSTLVTVPAALIQLAVPAMTLLPYGKGYTGNEGVVQWMMLDSAIIGLLTPVMNQMVVSMNRMWFGFSYSAIYSLLYGGLAYLLVPRYGAAGLAAAPIIAHLTCLGPCFLYIYRTEMTFASSLPLFRLTAILAGTAALAYAGARWLPPEGACCLALTLIAGFLFLQARILKGRLISTGGTGIAPRTASAKSCAGQA